MANGAWTVQEANAQLSELLRRARAGQPQRIDMTDGACVVISAKAWEALNCSTLGSWLVDSAPVGEELELPARGSHRTELFAPRRVTRK
jgi:prevent-host-death family protein